MASLVTDQHSHNFDPNRVRDNLYALLAPYVDDKYFPLRKAVNQLEADQLQALHQRGYDGPEIAEALAIFFSSEFHETPAYSEPMAGVQAYHLMNGDQRESIKIRLFSSIVTLSKNIHAKELATFFKDCSGFPTLFDEINLSDLETFAGRLHEITELGSLNIDWQDYSCKFQSCLAILEHGGSANSVRALTELKSESGKPVFKIAWDFRQFIQNGGGPEDARTLMAMTNSANDLMFESAHELARAQHHRREHSEQFINCLQAMDRWHEPIFRYGGELNEFLDNAGTHKRAVLLANLKGPDGARAFTGYEILMLQEARIDLKTCREWAEKGRDAVQEIYRMHLGLDSVDFTNDGRPKCLLLVPTDDDRQFGMRAFLDASRPFYRTLTRSYDVCIRATWSAREACDLLSLYGQECALVDISGHGSRSAITVAREMARYKGGARKENLKLMQGSSELQTALSQLKSGTRLLLNACSTATGGLDGNHLAGWIAANNPTLAIIASREPFSSKNVVMDSVYPLRLKIFSSRPGVGEITYSSFAGSTATPDRDQYAILNSQRERRLQLELIPMSRLVGPLHPDSIKKAQFDEVQKEIEFASYPLIHAKDMQHAADSIDQVAGVTIIEKRDLVEDWGQTSWQYLFGERLNKPWCPALGNTYGSEVAAISEDVLGFLSSKGYYSVDSPQNGDIAVYFNKRLFEDQRNSSHPLTGSLPQHFGEYEDGQIISKPWKMHVIKHPPDLHPLQEVDSGLKSEVFIVYFRDINSDSTHNPSLSEKN